MFYSAHFLTWERHLSKLPVSFQRVVLWTCSRGDISNTKIAPWKPAWPASYCSVHHIKMSCSAIATIHGLILISLFRFPADWQCQLQHFTPFFFSMCEITNMGTVERESAGFSSCFSVCYQNIPLFSAGSRTGQLLQTPVYKYPHFTPIKMILGICLNS